MADLFCHQCGHHNPEGANFCSSCGVALEGRGEEHTITLAPVEPETATPEEEVAVSFDELPEGTGMLVIRRGPGAGSKFVLEPQVVTVGRHPDSTIFLDDVTVSRRHAELRRGVGGYSLHDVGSLNGTYLNRERIEDRADLRNGDEVQIGRFKLVFLTQTGAGDRR